MSDAVTVPPEFSRTCLKPAPKPVRIVAQFFLSFIIYGVMWAILELLKIKVNTNQMWSMVCIAPSIIFIREIYEFLKEKMRDCFAHDTYLRLWVHYSKDVDKEDRVRIVSDMTRNAVYQRRLQQEMQRQNSIRYNRYNDRRYDRYRDQRYDPYYSPPPQSPSLTLSTDIGAFSF